MIIYIHGFAGNGLGTKARLVREHFKTEAIAPSLPYVPDLALDSLKQLIEGTIVHEPVHLIVKDPALQKSSEHDVFAGPSTRYCPAGVYEWVEVSTGPKFVINAQNCVHCKTCDIKDPNQNINLVPPQGGEGPVYTSM
jgi:ferredoxin-like protein FixX